MGNKIKGEYRTYKVWLNNKLLDIKESQAVINHSDDFMWGYNDSGPAQLALAILLDVTEKVKALGLYQRFKEEILAPLSANDFNIKIDINKWVEKKWNNSICSDFMNEGE